MRGGKTKSFLVWLLFFLAGAIIGGLLGELIAGSPAFSGIAPYVTKKYIIFDMSPASINLFIVQMKFGLTIQPNLISVIGVVIAMIFFQRF